MAIREAGKGERIIGINLHCLFISPDRSADGFFRALMIEVSSFQKELVGLRLGSGPVGQQPLLFTTQLDLQVLSDFPGKIFRQRQQVCARTSPAVAPGLISGGRIDQLGLDAHIAAPKHRPSGNDGSHAQLPADCRGIQVRSFVSERRAPRHNLQLGKEGENIVQTFRDSVAQIIRVGVGAAIHEGQHDERADGAALGFDGQDGRDQSVAPFGNGLNDLRRLGIIAKDPAQSGDGARQHIVGHKGVRPHGADQALLRHDFAGAFRQMNEHLHGLRFQANGFVLPGNGVQRGLH